MGSLRVTVLATTVALAAGCVLPEAVVIGSQRVDAGSPDAPAAPTPDVVTAAMSDVVTAAMSDALSQDSRSVSSDIAGDAPMLPPPCRMNGDCAGLCMPPGRPCACAPTAMGLRCVPACMVTADCPLSLMGTPLVCRTGVCVP